MFGDIVKVTPTSKVVGDMALFMVANNLTPADVLDGPRELAFPESVVEFFEGRLGEPPGGFPEKLQKRVLRGRKPMTGRPGASLPPADFAATKADLEKLIGRPVNDTRGRDATCSIRASSRSSPRIEAKYSDTERAADAGVLLRHGTRRGGQHRHRARQDADRQVPDGRRPARGRQPDGVLRAERPAARDGGDGQDAGRPRGRPAEGASRATRWTWGRRCRAWWCACWRRPARRWRPGRSCSRWKR